MKEGFEKGKVIPWWKKSVHSGEPHSLVLQLHREGDFVPSGFCGGPEEMRGRCCFHAS